ncbi:hypothetical protein PGTUg99_026334 [Puccinia graminis f. sp. tritici]|uniref:Uncharacterized protein n=1 Tax=Puccinia graminis f. sp. tritici TaxID=56615 RepID=A0A5B0RWH5_PUCGR|nr:hypothetical protein PGTUg99_026334 [Puccinia graminis f. sp. tritici]
MYPINYGTSTDARKFRLIGQSDQNPNSCLMCVKDKESEENNKTVMHTPRVQTAVVLTGLFRRARRHLPGRPTHGLSPRRLASRLGADYKKQASFLAGIVCAVVHEDVFKATHPAALRTSLCIHDVVSLFGNTVLMTWVKVTAGPGR